MEKKSQKYFFGEENWIHYLQMKRKSDTIEKK